MDLETLRTVARQEADVFEGKASVNKYHHDTSDLTVDILCSLDAPEPGLNSYGTIGMSDFDAELVIPDGLLRIELVGAAQSRWTAMPSGLSACAFNVGTGQYSIAVEAVYPNVFAGYQSEVTTPHAFFWQPFIWRKDFENVVVGNVTISFLMAIPITDSEFEFIRERSVDAFVDELERQTPDTYDMSRAGIV